jgi:hypothetical protein
MPFIGNTPAQVPLTSADIADGIITSAKIVDGTIVNADINASAAIASTKLSGVGATAGQVIQVVQATDSTSRTTTSNSFVTASSTLTVNITPSSASNKILVVLMLCGFGSDSANTNARATVYRDATNISPSGGFADNNVVSGGAYYVGGGNSFLDSPNTTSQVTYQFYMQNSGGSNTARVSNGGFSSLTCYEIKV